VYPPLILLGDIRDHTVVCASTLNFLFPVRSDSHRRKLGDMLFPELYVFSWVFSAAASSQNCWNHATDRLTATSLKRRICLFLFSPRRILTDSDLVDVLKCILNHTFMHKESSMKCFKASDISERCLARISDRIDCPD
jgi:hypothetical protein